MEDYLKSNLMFKQLNIQLITWPPDQDLKLPWDLYIPPKDYHPVSA